MVIGEFPNWYLRKRWVGPRQTRARLRNNQRVGEFDVAHIGDDDRMYVCQTKYFSALPELWCEYKPKQSHRPWFRSWLGLSGGTRPFSVACCNSCGKKTLEMPQLSLRAGPAQWSDCDVWFEFRKVSVKSEQLICADGTGSMNVCTTIHSNSWHIPLLWFNTVEWHFHPVVKNLWMDIMAFRSCHWICLWTKRMNVLQICNLMTPEYQRAKCNCSDDDTHFPVAPLI